MKLRILVDNYTFIDQYYLGEPGLSFYIETEGKTYLLDTGYSDILLKNAVAMGVELKNLNGVILSHGHNDHTRGMSYLRELYADGKNRPDLIAHPQVFWHRREGKLAIGMPLSRLELQPYFQIKLSDRPLWLTSKLVYLGEIGRSNDFEGQHAIGEIETPLEGWQPDHVRDDSALAYCTNKGLVVLTGCSHAGICNIIEQAKRICKEKRIAAVVGGFHLLQAEDEKLQKTIDYLCQQQIGAIYACHCTDFAAKMELAKSLPVYEAGVGLSLEWS